MVVVARASASGYVLSKRGGSSGGPEVTTASGLKFVELLEGTGATPLRGQTVTVHYTGTLANGTKFDSSVDRGRPAEYKIGVGEVIKGWDEGIMSMKVGGKRKSYSCHLAMEPGRPPTSPHLDADFRLIYSSTERNARSALHFRRMFNSFTLQQSRANTSLSVILRPFRAHILSSSDQGGAHALPRHLLTAPTARIFSSRVRTRPSASASDRICSSHLRRDDPAATLSFLGG